VRNKTPRVGVSGSDSAIGALLRPRSVAVVGATERTYAGSIPLMNLRAQGFAGPVYPVSRKHSELFGYRCYPSIDALPTRPDAVMLSVGVPRVVRLATAAMEAGSRALVVPTGGFTETGEQGRQMARELAEIAPRHDACLCGPNGMGVINFVERSSLYIGHFPHDAPAGPLAGVFHSGSICEGMLNTGGRLRFSYLVSSGGEDVTDVADYLDFFAGDERVRVVLLYLEGMRRPGAFLAAVDGLMAAGKAVVLLRAGRSTASRANALAHSGMLAPDDRVFTAALRRRGVTLVDDLDQLVETAVLFAAAVGTSRRGSRVQVVTNSGGEASVCLDVAESVGLALPDPPTGVVERMRESFPHYSHIGNPADAWGVGDAREVYDRLFAACEESDEIDTVVAALDATVHSGESQVEIAATICRSLVESTTDAKFRVISQFFSSDAAPELTRIADAASIPLLRGLRESVTALRHLRELDEGPRWGAAAQPAPSPGAERRVLDERDARVLLEAYAIPLAATVLVRSQREAADAARRLGLPVVAKVSSADLPHKTEVGGVELDICSLAQVRAAYRRIMERASAHARPDRIDGVGIQAAVAGGVECIAGMTRSPDFGPMVVFGWGGIYTEVLGDAVIEPAPISAELAADMIDRTRVGKVLAGVRNTTPRDIAAVSEILVALGRLACEHPEIQEVDLNPIFVKAAGQGASIVDALVVVADPEGAR
jgi:acyl-CoA synthetase (NDP forming)